MQNEFFRCCELCPPDFYGKQAGLEFQTREDALKHFCRIGQTRNYNPHPSFNTKWYKWQHPDVINFKSILHHFLFYSENNFFDPSPYIDLRKLQDVTGTEDIIELINLSSKKEFGPMHGVYHDHYQLIDQQKNFQHSHSCNLVKALPSISSDQQRRNLVWVQLGPGTEFFKWFDANKFRTWDLLANCYEKTPVDAEGILLQPGTKFTGMAHVWENYPETFEGYESVIFIDDDLQFIHEDIDLLFQTAEENQIDVFQPALAKGSFGTWPVFSQKFDTTWRQTNGVEIMMPGLRGNAIKDLLPLFCYSVSGFGIDLLMAEVSKNKGYTSGVIDTVAALHTKEIDQTGGRYYNYLRSKGINPNAELWYLIDSFGLDIGFVQL